MKASDKRKPIAKILLLTTLASLSIFVFLPTFYLISFPFTQSGRIYQDVFANPLIGDEIGNKSLDI